MNSVFDIPFYRRYKESGIPLIDKEMIRAYFPEGFLTGHVKKALADGEAQYVTTTGTSHDRMQLIRPKFFLLKQYFEIWKNHPELSRSWEQNCPRISLTTYRATQHVSSAVNPTVEDRTFGDKTLYVNTAKDPACWDKEDLLRMLEEITDRAPYHMDCDPVYLAMFMVRLRQENLWHLFPQPETTVHAYETATSGVVRFLRKNLNGPVVNLYGSTELGFLFSQSYSGIRESYLKDCEIEYLPVAPGVWSMVVTSTRNPYMPLIRYRCGDCVEMHQDIPETGNTGRILGREREIVTGADRRLPHIHFDDLVAEVSEDLFIYRLDLLKNSVFSYNTFSGEGFDSVQERLLRETVEQALGTWVTVRYSGALPPVASGKYPWVTFDRRTYDG